MLYRLKRFLSECLLRKLHFSLVYSHLNSHMISWGGTTLSALNPLKVANNKAICNICSHSLNTDNKFTHLQILNIDKIYKLKLAQFMYKTLICNTSPLIENIIPQITFSHEYSTRSNNLKLPKIRTELNRRFFLSNAIKFWLCIPENLKTNNLCSNTFKNKIKILILELM